MAGLIARAVAGEAAALQLRWRRRTVRLDGDVFLLLDGGEPVEVERGQGRPLEFGIGGAECARAVAGREGGANGLLGHLWPLDEGARAAFAAAPAGAGGAAAGGRMPAATGAPAAVGADAGIAIVRAAAAAHDELRRRAASLGCAKASTRDALLERILLAADLVASRYDDAIGVADMARAASLSRFHFGRAFRVVFGRTPHAFLTDRRADAARRRLASGDDRAEAATRAGFGSRSALFRNLRRTGARGRCCPSA